MHITKNAYKSKKIHLMLSLLSTLWSHCASQENRATGILGALTTVKCSSSKTLVLLICIRFNDAIDFFYHSFKGVGVKSSNFPA